MKLRSVLQDCVFDKEFQNSPLVYQVGAHSSFILMDQFFACMAFPLLGGVNWTGLVMGQN